MIMKKKSQSQIVTTVLLILVVISLAVLIINFSVNFVNKRLSGTDCFEVAGKVTITDSTKYTCFDLDVRTIPPEKPNDLYLQIHVGDIEGEISSILVETGGANTITYKIIDGSTEIDDITMYQSTDDSPLELPEKNEERTYRIFFGSKPETVKIYPILENGDICDATDVLNTVDLCTTL